VDDKAKQVIFADRKLGVHTVAILPGQLAMLEGGTVAASGSI
jgi:hypothetical protein